MSQQPDNCALYPRPWSITPKEKRTRASKPKVRTGCFTCKRRRVKCDETHPSCAKCAALNIACEGYAPYSLTSTKAAREKAWAPQLTLEHFPTAKLFQDDSEYQHFRHFRDMAVSELSTSLGISSKVWEYVVEQASTGEACLRTLLIAVAALNKAGASEQGFKVHREYALKKYGRGLEQLRVTIPTQDQHHNSTLAIIAALLIFCFEMQTGDIDSTIEHLHVMVPMVSGRKLDCKQRRSHFLKIDDGSVGIDLEHELFLAVARAKGGECLRTWTAAVN